MAAAPGSLPSPAGPPPPPPRPCEPASWPSHTTEQSYRKLPESTQSEAPKRQRKHIMNGQVQVAQGDPGQAEGPDALVGPPLPVGATRQQHDHEEGTALAYSGYIATALRRCASHLPHCPVCRLPRSHIFPQVHSLPPASTPHTGRTTSPTRGCRVFPETRCENGRGHRNHLPSPPLPRKLTGAPPLLCGVPTGFPPRQC